jgi:hypothetical protein
VFLAPRALLNVRVHACLRESRLFCHRLRWSLELPAKPGASHDAAAVGGGRWLIGVGALYYPCQPNGSVGCGFVRGVILSGAGMTRQIVFNLVHGGIGQISRITFEIRGGKK